MILDLPEINQFNQNWNITFYNKFLLVKEEESYLPAINEFAKFIAANEKLIPVNTITIFLRKINDEFGIDEFEVLKTIDSYKKLTEPEEEKKEPEEIKETPFYKAIQFIREHYRDLHVNSLTGEIIYQNSDEKIRILDAETLFTEFAFENIKIQPKAIYNYFYSKKYTRHMNPILNILNETDYKPGTDPDFISEALSFLKFSNLPEIDFDLHDFYKKMFEKWLVRAIDNAINENALPNKQILIIKGPQNSRKTALLWWLYDPFKEYAIKNVDLNPKENKTKKILAANMFILNDEFGRMTNKNLQHFKIVSTINDVKIKQYYTIKILKRISNFISSTNEKKFLTDRSGNVRYIIIEIAHTKTNPISADLLDNTDLSLNMWSQAFSLWKDHKNGFYDAQITGEELLKLDKINKRYYTYRNLDDAIKYLYPKAEDDNDIVYLSASELLEHMRNNPAFPKNLIAGKTPGSIGKLLSNNFYERISKRIKKGKSPEYRYKLKIEN